MRILIISSWYPPIQSGSSFYAENLALGLTKRGHEVSVVTTDWHLQSQLSKDQDGVIVHYLPARVLPRLSFLLNLKIVPISCTPSNWRSLLSIVRKFEPDIIHQVNHIFDTVFLSALLARRTGIPLMCSVTTPVQHPNPILHRVMRLVDRIVIGKFVAPSWKRVICLDSEVLRYLRETYGEIVGSRGVVIAYGIRDGFHEMNIAGGDVRKGNAPQIILVGHIHALRDPTNLVRAMPMIQRRFPDARMVFVGRIQLQRPVEVARWLGVESSVKFLGEMPHVEIKKLLRSSHVFAGWASGPYRGLGTAAAETMLCGTPLVIDLPQNLFGNGMLKNWYNIVLINRDDVQDIAESIIRLLEDDELRTSVGKRGSEFVSNHMKWDRIAEQIERAYVQ